MTVIAFPAPTEGKRKRPLHPSEVAAAQGRMDPFPRAKHAAPPWRRSCLPWCPTCWPSQYASQHALHRSDRP